jgi:hypothetical protein
MIASLCPNGKELRFAYGHELAAWSGAYGRLAAVVPGDKSERPRIAFQRLMTGQF